MKTRLSIFVASLLAIFAQVARGDDAIEWNGFLNVVGGILQHDPVINFNKDEKQYPGYQGYEDQFTFDPQTNAGLQGKKQLDEKTSVTLQLFAEGDNENYDAKLKWLYLSYEPTYHSSFRVGRIGAPIYYFSDYLNVGYAYHWITPPEGVYPFDTTITGIDYVYQDVWGDYDWSMELLTGGGDEYLPVIASRIIVRDIVGAALNISTGGWLSFRAMLYHSQATFMVDSLSEENINASLGDAVDIALAKMNITLDDPTRLAFIADTREKLDNGALDLDDLGITYGDLAIRAESERWLLMTEWITIRTNSYLYNTLVAGFVTAGVHVGPVFYHLTHTTGKSNPNDEVAVDLQYTLPDSPQPSDYADQLAAAGRSGLAGAFGRRQQSTTLGVRVETSANTALKFDIIQIEERASFDGDTVGIGKNLLFRTALNATF